MGPEEACTALVTWIRKHGGFVHDKLDLFHQLPNGDRGVVATADIEAGAELAIVPLACTLHIPTAAETANTSPEKLGFPPAAVHLASAVPTETSPFIATVLVAMSEVARGDKSPWHAYISALPPSCDCLLSWSDEDKAQLKGTSIEDVTGGAATERAFNKEVAPQVQAHPDLWPAPHNTFAEFCRVAGLVQSRAFHMVAENWVTGTKQEGAELFMIPGIDMINHASDASRRNSSLFKFNTTMSKEVDGKPVEITGFFTMTAEKAIKAGEQVLHTYGDLSDAQLLQTYGFIDMGSEQPAPQAAAGGGEGSGSKKKGAKAAAAPAGAEVKAWVNPFNHALVPLSCLMEASRAAVKVMGSEEEGSAALESSKVAFLQQAQLLQPAAPLETHFVVTAAKPLPDELLTVVQVLLMTQEEFDQLVAEYQETQPAGTTSTGAGEEEEQKQAGKQEAAAAGGSKGGEPMQGVAAGSGLAAPVASTSGSASSSVPSTGSSGARQPLVLGEDLLGEDLEFAESCSLILIQAVEACTKRFPSKMNQDAQQLAQLQQQLASPAGATSPAADKGQAKKKRKVAGGAAQASAGAVDPAEVTALQRKMLALKVRLGEQEVLQRTKKEAVMMVFRLQAAAAARQEGGSGSDDDDEDDEDEDSDEGEGSDDGSDEGEDEADQTDSSGEVGYADEEFDDDIGQAHDKGKARPAPKD